jgi:hypothetical protein
VIRTTFRALTFLLSLFLTFSAIVRADDTPYGNLKLLKGYKYKRSHTFDTANGLIYKEGGLSIEFESGSSEGYAADPTLENDYLWFREQTIKGHKVYLALTEAGRGTKWEPDRWRGPKPGRILMITFPGNLGPMHASNFYAEVLDEKEIADMMLMALTFDPTK